MKNNDKNKINNCCCHSEKQDAVKSDCCHSEKPNLAHSDCCHSEKQDAVKGDCCHSEKQDLAHSDCCHGDKQDSVKGDCCHSEKQDLAHSDCCHGDKQDSVKGDCCHGDKPNLAHSDCCHSDKQDSVKSDCCHGDKPNLAHSDCCHGDKQDSVKSDCCHSEKQDAIKSDCCHSEKPNLAHSDCCHSSGTAAKKHGKKNKKAPYAGNCCGIDNGEEETEHSGNCCGIDDGKAKEHKGNCCGIDHSAPKKKGVDRRIIFMIISLASIIVSYIEPFHNSSAWVRLFDFAWIAIILCGLPIYRGAIKNLFRKKITSALLISIAMTASIVMGILTTFDIASAAGHGHSYFFAAGEIAFLMALGSLIEDITVRKSRSAVGELISMTPAIATVKGENGYMEIPVKDIKVGDTVLCKPNVIIPIDGIITDGSGSINQASITGESTPVEKTVGEDVYQGTINLSNAFEIQATKKSDETTLSKLIEYVKKAEKNRAPIVRLADKWAGYIVPGAVLISIIVFFISFFGIKAGEWGSVSRAITILVVVCPCALALATPIAVSAGIGNSSKKGVLIKTGSALESLAKINIVAFDKTGTLTEGKLKVSRIVKGDMEEKDLIYYAAGAELQSEHPIAKAIIEYSNNHHGTPEETESLTGIGVRAKVDGKLVEAVKPKSVEQLLKSAPWYKEEGENATAIAVVIDNKPEGVIYITDTVREGAAETIRALNAAGITTVMLTGDNAYAAEGTAKELGVTEFKSDLMPEDKVNAIEKYKENGKRVLMVGDGVNDAPSLASSDCSLAMGAMGSSVAIETADISLMTSDLRKIPFLIRLAKRTLITIKLNISLSLLISFVSVFLSTFALIGVVGGALIHNASSVLVCINSALLLIYKGGRKNK